jgi:hypothetical protein
MLEDYFEEEEEEEQWQQPASAEVAITDNGQRNQPNSTAICVLASREKAQCARCDMGLCVVPCFAEYHTKVNL